MIEPIFAAFADDHPLSREGLAKLLKDFGNVDVSIEADNGEELIRKISRAERLPDVVLLDINMPVMNGFETLREMLRRWPDIKTLVVTAHPSELYIIRMIMGGAKGYVLKSAPTREIERAIIAVHNDGIYHSEASKEAFRDHTVKLPHFTEQELIVLKYCCTNLSYAQIGKKLDKTSKGVEGIKESLFKKLKVNTRTTLALYAVQLGMVTAEASPAINIEDLQP